MSTVMMRKGLRGLEAVDEAGADVLRRIKASEVVRVEVTKPRNLSFHRRFFALLTIVWQTCGDWPSVEDLLIELKVRIGHVREVVIRDSGEVVKVPESISFSAMDETAFWQFYEKCVQVICTDMVPGLDDAALREEVLRAVA